MTEEMIKTAEELFIAAKKYKELYEDQYGKQPVVWVQDNDTGEGLFIADSYNTQIMRSRL